MIAPYAYMVAPKNNRLERHFAVLALSVFYAWFLAGFHGVNIVDRENYIIYAETSALILASNLTQGLNVFLANEPLWLLLNVALSSILQADLVVRFIIFGSAFLVAYYVLKKCPRGILFGLFVLFAFAVIKNHIIHLRQGVAVAVFLLAMLCTARPKMILLTATPFIHSSFFFILLIYVAAKITSYFRLSVGVSILIYILVGLLIAISLSTVAAAMGARQAELYTYHYEVDRSGLAFLLWLCLLTIVLLEGGKFFACNRFAAAIVVFYLTNYFFVDVAARILESGFILVCFMLFALKNNRLFFVFPLILILLYLPYLLRVSEPLFGFIV